MTSNFPWPTIIVLLPILAGLPIPLCPPHGGNNTVRWYTPGVCPLEFLPIICASRYCFDFDNPFVQWREDYDRINVPPGFHWRLGVDGLSMGLILPTGLVTTLATPAAWPVTRGPRLFYPSTLAMYSGQVGLFASQDISLSFPAWEPEPIPVYLPLAPWGGKRRLYAATKSIPYTAGGSIFLSAGAITLGGLYAPPGPAPDFRVPAGSRSHPVAPEMASYPSFPIAYAVKLPIIPSHTWLPDTHGEAHYSTCTLLAGVLPKMGGHGPIRINMELLPRAHSIFAPRLTLVGAIQIVYAALVSINQRGLKGRIAYPPVPHTGFVLIGIGSTTEVGLRGAVLQMISHGLIGAAPSSLAGTGCDRTRTPFIGRMGGMAVPMPGMFTMFSSFSFASIAPPGMVGFVAELMVHPGVVSSRNYSSGSKMIVIAVGSIGMILTPIHLPPMLRRMFYGYKVRTTPAPRASVDSGPREIFIPLCLPLPMIGMGLYPDSVLSLRQSGIELILVPARGS
uniref:NADH-plastoquinone oxidoreductase subunit 4 n=1 Tax=Selaginella remotifolia TaxID=137170 RepID=A0A482CI09_SELRE|nr:NADH-plastoquinone oxidoreductase subunit 4 [Selaginella remotifolia]QBL76303.1 NADH-plastoquinone oxidoreductase subunit 4 [Selaginella remotifolia]